MRFSLPVRVYWEDTDAGGVVYHAQYVAFLERARTEWLRAQGFDQGALKETEHLIFVVHSMSLDFKAPAKLDDLLEATARLVSCKKVSFEFEQTVERDGQTLVNARVKAAVLDSRTMKPRGMPAGIYEQLHGAMS